MRIFILICFFLAVNVGNTNAMLSNQGNGIILDTDSGSYWWQDLSDFVNLSYNDQLGEIGGLPGIGWHMASQSEMEGLWSYNDSEIADVFIPALTTTDNAEINYNYFYGRFDQIRDTQHYAATLLTFSTGFMQKNVFSLVDDTPLERYGAWVTTQTIVPIPGAVWLLGSCLVGIIGFRRKLKK